MKNALKNIFRQKFITISIISVSFVIFLLINIVVLMTFITNQYSKSIEKLLYAEIYLTNGCVTKTEDVTSLQTLLGKTNDIIDSKYISEDDNLTYYYEEKFKDNPVMLAQKPTDKCILPPSLNLTFNNIDGFNKIISILTENSTDFAKTNLQKTDTTGIESKYSDIDKFLTSKSTLIETVYSPFTGQTNSLKTALTTVRNISLAFLAMLIFVCLMIFFVCMALLIRLRAEEIGVMHLVGASRLQIKLPFLIEGAIYGFVSATLASLVFFTIYVLLYTNNLGTIGSQVKDALIQIDAWRDLMDSQKNINMLVPIIFFVPSLVGIVIGIISTYIIVTRYE